MAYLPNTVRDRYLSYMTFAKYNARTITNRDAYLEELEKSVSWVMLWIMKKN